MSSEQSRITIGKRVPKSSLYPDGWQVVDHIDPEETCVLYLGGGHSLDGEKANGYTKIIKSEILKDEAFTDEDREQVGVYSIVYDFATENRKQKLWTLTQSLFAQHGMILDKAECADVKQHLAANPEMRQPAYIGQLFNEAILPRLTDETQTKLEYQEVARRIRGLNLVAHCHGGYVALKLEELMQNKMRALGYTREERDFIQSQLLVVAHEPSCPLGVSKSQFISFLSVFDESVVQADNLFGRYVQLRREEHKEREKADNEGDLTRMGTYRELKPFPAFFEGKKGNFFLVLRKFFAQDRGYGYYEADGREHLDVYYNAQSKTRTEEGRQQTQFARNILVNGILNSLAQKDGFTPLPPIHELVQRDSLNLGTIDSENFYLAEQNGNIFWNLMKKHLADHRCLMQEGRPKKVELDWHYPHIFSRRREGR